MEISTWYQNPEVTQEETERRRMAAQAWVEGALLVAETTDDPLAHEIMHGVLSGIGVAKPISERRIVALQGPEQPTVLLVPLFAEDTQTNDTTRRVMEPASALAAIYTENTPGRIYVNAEDGMSPLLRGLLLLHEANHARLHGTNQFREDTELDTWYEEVATFEFEFGLLAKLCGQSYQDLLAKIVPEFIKEFDDKDGKGGTPPKPSTVDVDSLKDVFGTSESEREQGLRRSIVWLNAIFRMVEEIYPETVDRDKAQFLKQLYTNNT